MKSRLICIGLLLGLLTSVLAGCALTDIKNTPVPPVTLKAPPELNFTGSCDNSRDLENWLQITTIILSEFRTKMSDTAVLKREETSPGLQRMVQLRDSVYLAATPDCGHDAQVLLSDALNRAVQAFQSYINGDLNDISGKVAEVSVALDQVAEMNAELTVRLQDEIQKRLQVTVTPPNSGG